MEDLHKSLVAIRCKFCERTVASFRGDNKTAMQKAIADNVNTLCPHCHRLVNKDAMLESTIVIPDPHGEGLEAARRSRVLYE